MNLGLKDRIAIVAASSKGIGKAAALAFAAEGCKLALCARNGEALRQLALEIRNQHKVEVFTQTVDVTEPQAVQEFVEATGQKFGRIDICVTNAGGPPAKQFLETDTEIWRKAFELNLLSVISFAREVIPWMQKRKWGRIVTITSTSTKQPIPELILSNTIRTGVLGLVRSLANEFGRDGILVNNVGPGATLTDRLEDMVSLLQAKSTGASRESIPCPLSRQHGYRQDCATLRCGRRNRMAGFRTRKLHHRTDHFG